ncbi:hypothetical protein [Kibdelosporangium phytohabitans]|uniref:PBP domain-containing protein n=1 Tax=Kibdelosporangium phytohabitans TaxID=860235 RepID=A0A0N9HXB2_9PSEU|nr:hypothetical protein [Kibdelosporangium phytohabitans]ALG06528.1 hypothetical protein AOZ06_05940 [Kibdelosporangium phytohabitans]MBE1467710.1 hypothetical protein [Kibdelosporangium phytohabitans]
MRKALPLLALTSVVSLLAAGLVMFLPMTAAGQQDETSAVTQTRAMEDAYSFNEAPGKYQASITVAQTKGLVRQRVKVSWSGLKPTGSISGGTSTPYPVVVMQCWGTKDEITPQTCWNGGPSLGTVINTGVVLADPHPYDGTIYGPNPLPIKDTPKSVVPFKARDVGDDGKHKLYSGTQDATGWPEGAVLKSNPPAFSEATKTAIMPDNYIGSTRPDGTGEADIELLTSFENPHLGCSSTAACSLVVIPVGDPTCQPDANLPAKLKGMCRNTTRPTLRSADLWATPTNWSRRFTFDLSFRESPDSCAIDSRPETGFSGSYYAYQLLNNSWRPKFCHDTKLFKLGYTALSDGEARGQYMTALGGPWQDGSTNALLTSRVVEGELPKPTVYAPVAVTGVAISFVLDDPRNKEVTELKLNARLLAKLLTQSYRTNSPSSTSHPGVKNNPAWWGADPEFHKLNPELAGYAEMLREGSEYPVVSLGDSDAIHALTSYIAADKDAVAWLGGADDGNGMVVNPKFKGYKLPIGQLELRDDWVIDDNPNSPLLGQIMLSAYANVAESPYNAAVTAVQAWPYASLGQTCVGTPPSCTLKRISERQRGGSRAMLAITSLGDSKVFGLRQAALQTKDGTFAKPDDYSLAIALRSTKLDEKTGVLTPDVPAMEAVAYPGMSVVYAAIPTTGLSTGTADNYAKFLEHAAGPGQVRGYEAGQLSDGYVPLSDPLKEQAANAAKAVREQKGAVPPPPPGLSEDPAKGMVPPGDSTGLSGGGSGGGGSANATGSGGAPAGAAPTSAAPASASTAPPTVEKAATSVATRTDQSGFAKWVLPGLLGISVLAGVIAFGAMVWTQPQHPIRRWIRRLRTR